MPAGRTLFELLPKTPSRQILLLRRVGDQRSTIRTAHPPLDVDTPHALYPPPVCAVPGAAIRIVPHTSHAAPLILRVVGFQTTVAASAERVPTLCGGSAVSVDRSGCGLCEITESARLGSAVSHSYGVVQHVRLGLGCAAADPRGARRAGPRERGEGDGCGAGAYSRSLLSST